MPYGACSITASDCMHAVPAQCATLQAWKLPQVQGRKKESGKWGKGRRVKGRETEQSHKIRRDGRNRATTAQFCTRHLDGFLSFLIHPVYTSWQIWLNDTMEDPRTLKQHALWQWYRDTDLGESPDCSHLTHLPPATSVSMSMRPTLHKQFYEGGLLKQFLCILTTHMHKTSLKGCIRFR